MSIRTLLTLAAIALVACLVSWWGGAFDEPRRAVATARDPLPGPSAESRGGTPALSKAAMPSPSPAGRPSTAPEPLPPRDAPLHEILDELKARAARGDARAACRLGHELERCRRILVAKRKALELQERSGTEWPHGERRQRALAEAAKWERLVQRDEAACALTSPNDAGGGWRYFLQAAKAGHVPSMVRFVTDMSLLMDGGFPGAKLDGYNAYRELGPAFLEAGIEEGYWEAFNIGAMYFQSGNILGVPFPQDPVRATALWLALADAAIPGQVSREGRHPRDSHTADEMARAESLAATYRAYLRKRHAPGTLDLTKAAGYEADDRERCEAP